MTPRRFWERAGVRLDDLIADDYTSEEFAADACRDDAPCWRCLRIRFEEWENWPKVGGSQPFDPSGATQLPPETKSP